MKETPETLAAILAEMRKSAKDSYAEKTVKRLEDHEATGTRDALDIKDAIQCLRDDDKYLLGLADRIEEAVSSDRRKDCEQCIHDRVRDEAVKEIAEQMSPAEETDRTLLEMRRAATNGRMAIKENPVVRSALECYVDNTIAYANRLEDSITRERRRAATKLSLAELHIKTLQKQFKHHGELE